jgi:secretion/DNA translocation related CpaE-like protein
VRALYTSGAEAVRRRRPLRFAAYVATGRAGRCIGVIAGSGGAGGTALAAALAATASPAVLIDLDTLGAGLDLALGIEKVPGTRWSGLHSDGGRIDPDELAAALPRWAGVSVLSCDRDEISPAAVGSVLEAAARLGTVVVDLGRCPTPAQQAAVACCRLVAVLARATVPGVAAVGQVVARLGEAPWCLVVGPQGTLPKRRVAGALRVSTALAFEQDRALADPRGVGIDAGAIRRSVRALAQRLVELSEAS